MLAHARCCHWYAAREQPNHDVLQHAGLGHEQHDDDIDMNLENMLPLQQVFNLGQDDMLEDGNRQLREHIGIKKFDADFAFCGVANLVPMDYEKHVPH